MMRGREGEVVRYRAIVAFQSYGEKERKTRERSR